MSGIRLALIVDNRSLTRWQVDALRLLGSQPKLVLSCTNTRLRRRWVKHGLYYVLNIFSIRNAWTRKAALQDHFDDLEIIDFESEYEGVWQRLPDCVVDRIRGARPDAILKFGMSLMRVPEGLDIPILSYHHGDPDQYRGRPAGFYELLQRRSSMGQIVQIISNKLDSGTVVAFARTRVHQHSYRATMKEAYRHSPLLLKQAVANAVSGRTLKKHCRGRNYRLPGNLLVLRLVWQMTAALLKRLFYGAFMEKQWNVALAQAGSAAIGAPLPPRNAWRNVPRLPRYSFYADPFFCTHPSGIIVEALNRHSGKGELVVIPSQGPQWTASDGRCHFSYPGSIVEDGQTYVIPETARWSRPQAFLLSEGGLQPAGLLDIQGEHAIVDPTLFRHDGRLYLFGNKAEIGSGALCLWSSDQLFGRFVEHPASPLLISPAGARMAGGLVRNQQGLFRLGQNGLGSYGDGIFVFQIQDLTPLNYRETLVDELRFDGVRGPHTINWKDGEVLFDWYEDILTPFAWLRRLRGRLPR